MTSSSGPASVIGQMDISNPKPSIQTFGDVDGLACATDSSEKKNYRPRESAGALALRALPIILATARLYEARQPRLKAHLTSGWPKLRPPTFAFALRAWRGPLKDCCGRAPALTQEGI